MCVQGLQEVCSGPAGFVLRVQTLWGLFFVFFNHMNEKTLVDIALEESVTRIALFSVVFQVFSGDDDDDNKKE